MPDGRVDALSAIFNPRKTTYSRLDVTDTVAIREGELKNETIDAKSLQQIRQSDAVLTVLRHFDNGQAADPAGDFLRIREEFILADMVQTEGAWSGCANRTPSSPTRPFSRNRPFSSSAWHTSSRALPWRRSICPARTTRRSAGSCFFRESPR